MIFNCFMSHAANKNDDDKSYNFCFEIIVMSLALNHHKNSDGNRHSERP